MSIARYWAEMGQARLNAQQPLNTTLETRPSIPLRTRQVESLIPPARPEFGQFIGSDLTDLGLNRGNLSGHPKAPLLSVGPTLAKVLVNSAPAEYPQILYSFATQYANEQMQAPSTSLTSVKTITGREGPINEKFNTFFFPFIKMRLFDSPGFAVFF